MNLELYVSLLEGRLFLALSGLLGAFFLDVVHGTLFRHHADPRPIMERVADMLIYPLASRMNRAGRADGTLIMRGVVILALACALFFGVIGYAYHIARDMGVPRTTLNESVRRLRRRFESAGLKDYV